MDLITDMIATTPPESKPEIPVLPKHMRDWSRVRLREKLSAALNDNDWSLCVAIISELDRRSSQ